MDVVVKEASISNISYITDGMDRINDLCSVNNRVQYLSKKTIEFNRAQIMQIEEHKPNLGHYSFIPCTNDTRQDFFVLFRISIIEEDSFWTLFQSLLVLVVIEYRTNAMFLSS